MEGRTYPRKWYRVDKHATDCARIVERDFVGETEHTLKEAPHRGRHRFTKKITNFERWFPTREEAEAVVLTQRNEMLERQARERVRRHAPQLLEAAKLALEVAESHIENEYAGTGTLYTNRMAELQPVRDAIKLAEGND